MTASPRKFWARTLVLVSVGAAAMTLSGCSLVGTLVSQSLGHGASGGVTATSTDGPKSDVFSIKVGDCLNDANSTDSNGTVSQVPIVSCTVPHDSEVIASAKVPEGNGKFPGDDALKKTAEQQCNTPFEKFTGATLSTTNLDYTYYFPSIESWKTGDREIMCEVYNPDGRVTGSLKGLGPKYPKT